MIRPLLVLGVLLCAWPASAQTNECQQNWTFDGNMRTLRNGVDVGGIGHPSAPFYRCVGGTEVWVIGQDGATWWRYNGNFSWSGPSPSGDPGGVQFLGLLGGGTTGECGEAWSFGPNGETLRNGVHVGGGYGGPTYRCVNGNTVYVIAGTTWFSWDGSLWTNRGSVDPGGTVITGNPPPNQVYVGEDVHLEADHNPACLDDVKKVLVNCTLGYRVYDNGVKLGPDLPPLSGTVEGHIVTPIFRLTATGSHSLVYAAFNATGEAQASALVVTAVTPPQTIPAPGPPSGGRVQ